VASEAVFGCRVFALRRERRRSPRDGLAHDFFVLDTPDWVNVIPVTSDGRVVMIRQYRHGIDEITLEIPGGTVDAGDPSPLDAARREMREETGYDSEDIVALGWVHPNPAIQNNRCHTFLARSVVKRAEPRWESTEETEVVLVPVDDLPALVRDGSISHALVVAAFYWHGLKHGGHAA
jgi:8-oxo-dGTP pyrophosphatase MutT (NUDIX family)